MKKLLLLLLLCATVSCKTGIKAPDIASEEITGVIAENAMVVSAREEASRIGLSILKEGGNAFDAMVATEMALAVSYPFAGNLGGGGFMVFRHTSGETGALDFRERAPLGATKNMYLDNTGNVVPGKSRLGELAVGVPGTVAGIFAVHERFGTMPMEQLLQPVIELAKNGFVVSENQQENFEEYRDLFLEVNEDTILFAGNYKAGDTMNYPEAEPSGYQNQNNRS